MLNPVGRSNGQQRRRAPSREVRVRVRGGYHPDVVRAEAGVPIRLLFLREEPAGCSEQVVFPAFGRSATLPQGELVAVDLLPGTPGEYEFTCGMGVLRGRLIVSGAMDELSRTAAPLRETEQAAVEWWLASAGLANPVPGTTVRGRRQAMHNRHFEFGCERTDHDRRNDDARDNGDEGPSLPAA